MATLIAFVAKGVPALPIAAGFAGGVLAAALLIGQAYAWLERRRIDWVGGAA